MNLSIVQTRALCGVESPLVRVETHLSNGLPSFTVVGLPEAAVRESRERVRCAILNSGFEFPMRRLTVNLAPADLPKEGGRFDLAIAIGILVASGQIDPRAVQGCEFISELALTGDCNNVRGVLPSLVAGQASARRIFVSTDDARYASLLVADNIEPVSDLAALVRHLKDPENCSLVSCPDPCGDYDNALDAARETALSSEFSRAMPDLSEVCGQYSARQALEVAASGGHNLMFYGPPGTGKSMLASRIVSILPPLSSDEAKEVASLYTLTNTPRAETDWFVRPYRSPHHSSSAVALVGGGAKPKPGEVSLAHCGVLFLDELPEYSRHSIEMLREPLETGEISISRAQQQLTLPAKFQLIAAMNPCPCGYLGHPTIACTDTPQQIEQYRRKLSGPFLDRIDMQVEVPFQSARVTMNAQAPRESSAQVLARVEQAQAKQYARQGCLNAHLKGELLDSVCALDEVQKDWLVATMDSLALSNRAAHRIMRLARTLADCAGEEAIAHGHLAQALRYRSVRR